MNTNLLVVKINDKNWCMEIADLKEIIRTQEITPVPKSLSYVEGIMNVKGEVVGIINIYKRLYEDNSVPLQNTADGEDKCVIIIEKNKQKYGFLVDSIARIFNLTDIQINPSSEKYQKGTIDINKINYPILDIDNLANEK